MMGKELLDGQWKKQQKYRNQVRNYHPWCGVTVTAVERAV
jgi:hypothetical protein